MSLYRSVAAHGIGHPAGTIGPGDTVDLAPAVAAPYVDAGHLAPVAEPAAAVDEPAEPAPEPRQRRTKAVPPKSSDTPGATQ